MADLPDYVTLWPDDQPSVDTTRHTRFTWRPGARSLAVDPKATPELLAELAATGAIDGMTELIVSEWAKAMTGLPPLPEAVARTLTRVEVNSTKLTDWSGMYALPALREFLVDEKVSVLPDGIAALSSLTHLTIKGKRLKNLPADLASLPVLTHLTIVNAPVTALPDTLGDLPLEHLSLSWTKKIKVLPDRLGASLRILETDFVPLKTLPADLLTSDTLEVLRIENAKLSKLGTRMVSPRLREVVLSGGFRKWPAEVDLPALEAFTVQADSKITALPDIWGPALRHVAVHAPLKSIDPRFAGLDSYMEGRTRMGLRVTCTQAAVDALSDAEQAAFAGRLKIWQ